VPASRRVIEASFVPPGTPRRRAITPENEAVAAGVSVTAKEKFQKCREMTAMVSIYQRFVKNRLGQASSMRAKAYTS
jgi:hypothetical protein